MLSDRPSQVRPLGGHLVGRKRERAVLDRLLERARGGNGGGVLVVHGEPGVGKTVLLDYAIEAAHEYRVATTSGVEGEMELPFAPRSNSCARPSSSWRSDFRTRSAMLWASPSA